MIYFIIIIICKFKEAKAIFSTAAAAALQPPPCDDLIVAFVDLSTVPSKSEGRTKQKEDLWNLSMTK